MVGRGTVFQGTSVTIDETVGIIVFFLFFAVATVKCELSNLQVIIMNKQHI